MDDHHDSVAKLDSAKHRLFRCHYAFLLETIHNPTTLAARLFLAGLARLEPLNFDVFKKLVEELEMKEISGKLRSNMWWVTACSVHVLQYTIFWCSELLM